ncbi:Uncharacterised protein [Serratia ficaria]|nr:Uncharacterised protein [Serratia ficaria]
MTRTDQAAVGILAVSGGDAFGDDGRLGVFADVDHLGAGIRLLMAAGQRHREEFADRVVALQDHARVFPGDRRAGFRLGPGHFGAGAFTQRTLGDEVQNAALALAAGEPVLHRRIFHLGVLVQDHLHHRRVQLVAVAHRRGTALDIADVAALVGDQNGAFELAGFGGVDAEVGRQLHRAAHALRHVDEGAVRGHGGVQRGEEVIVGRHHAAQVPAHQIRVFLNGFAERAEDHPALRQLFAVGGGDGNRVEDGVDRHFAALAHRHAQLVERQLHFAGQITAVGGGTRLLLRAGLRAAGVVAAAAGRRRVIAVILIVQAIVVGLQPVRLFHLQPGAIGFEAEFEHPLRLIALGRDRPHHVFVDAFG